MPSPPTNVRSAWEWRNRLSAELTQRQELIELYRDYYKGNHRLAFATAKFKEAFGDLFTAFADNWCEIVVDVVVDRMVINGFRFSGSSKNDDEAMGIWQANRLDARSMVAHTESVKTGWSYVSVGPGDGDVPKIIVESPKQVIVEHDPADPSVRLAAYKRYADARGNVVEVVYEPDRITTFTMPSIVASNAFLDRATAQLILPPGVSAGDNKGVTQDNPVGEVPVVEFANNPDVEEGGISDLRPAIKLSDAANKFFSDMLVASEFQAFRQRVLTGVEIPKDPVTNQPITDIEMAVSRLMIFAGDNAKAFDLQQGDLVNYINAIEMTIQHLAAQTRTPPHYLLAKLINLSGDALKAAESGLMYRARRKHIDLSDPWEDVQRLAFKWRHRKTDDEADRKRSEDMEIHTDWAPPETQAVSVVADSIAKKKEAGWPRRVLMEESGMSAQQIARAEEISKDERENELPSEDVISRIAALHDKLGIPFEVLYKKYLGMSDAQIREAIEKGPLGRGGEQDPAAGGQPPKPGQRPRSSAGQPQPRRDAAASTRR